MYNMHLKPANKKQQTLLYSCKVDEHLGQDTRAGAPRLSDGKARINPSPKKDQCIYQPISSHQQEQQHDTTDNRRKKMKEFLAHLTDAILI